MNLREAFWKHTFTDCLSATDNEHYKKAFISMCHLVNGWKKKTLVSTIESTTTRDLALNRLKAIVGSSEDQLEDADIKSDDESFVVSHPEFPCSVESGNESSSYCEDYL